MSVESRFLSKVIPEPNTGCWLWIGGITIKGYGTFNDGGKTVLAHRYSCRQVFGDIPVGLQIDHLCRIRCCVNPSHLEAVSSSENNKRSWPHYPDQSRKSSIANLAVGTEATRIRNLARTHCIHGHEYNSSNTRFYDVGPKRRVCVICLADNSRKHYQKHKPS